MKKTKAMLKRVAGKTMVGLFAAITVTIVIVSISTQWCAYAPPATEKLTKDHHGLPTLLEANSNEFKEVVLSKGLGIPVSLVRLDKENLAIASYLNIWVLNQSTGDVRELRKPDGVKGWYPTGLAYDQQTQELFVANYLGKDILILKGDTRNGFQVSARVTDPQLVGAENIALSRDGESYVVADFDNNGVILFDRKTNLKKWFVELGRAHGVAFDASDEKILASGLVPPQVVMVDLAGRVLKKKGQEGWGLNRYLWPTGLATDFNAKETWVADAHIGKVRALDEGLNEVKSFGGNGLGRLLFNMPYGIFVDDDSSLWVADTFKSRLLKLNRDKKIVAIYQSPDSGVGLTPAALIKGGHRADEQAIKSHSGHRSGYSNSAASQPIGRSYDKRINKGLVFSYGFGLYSNNEKWNPGFNYSAFTSLDGSRQLALAGATPFFSSSIYYWVQAEYGLKDRSVLIYGSPQVREWIVDDGAIVCPVLLGLDYWVTNEGLASSRGELVSFENILIGCAERKSRFEHELKKGIDPITAFSVKFLEKDPLLSFHGLSETFQSDYGKFFFKSACESKSAPELVATATRFLNDARSRDIVYLPEVWLARIFSHASHETDLDMLRTGCSGLK